MNLQVYSTSNITLMPKTATVLVYFCPYWSKFAQTYPNWSKLNQSYVKIIKLSMNFQVYSTSNMTPTNMTLMPKTATILLPPLSQESEKLIKIKM